MTATDDMTIYAFGAEMAVRGVEMERAESVRGDTFTDVWLHAQPEDEVDTIRVNISNVRYDGGSAALTEDLHERGMVPDWYAAGHPTPEEYDG